jgi:ABC-2 type transport system permease protein
MNLTYYRLELRRVRRDHVTLFFTAGLPAFMYVIFGASPDYGDEPVRDGNVAMWVMIAMAGYGAVTATTGLGGMAAVERMQGWSRQLGLTPLPDTGYLRVKVAVSLTIAALPIALVYAIGALTGAAAPPAVWLVSALVLLAGATMFALYGLSFGLAFRSEAAVSAASGSLVIPRSSATSSFRCRAGSSPSPSSRRCTATSPSPADRSPVAAPSTARAG